MSTVSFANNDIKNGVHSATDTVIDGASNLANDARKGVGAIENTIEDGAKNIGNAMYRDNTGYTATRTAIIATTIKSSARVNPFIFCFLIICFPPLPSLNHCIYRL